MKQFGLFLFILMMSLTTGAQTVNFGASQACFGDQTLLVDSSVAAAGDTIASWQWDFDNDGQFDDGSGQTHYHLFPQADTFKVALKIIYTSGGADSMTIPKNVVVHPLPQVNFQADNLCAGQPATYVSLSSIASGTIDQYLWDFNNDGVTDTTGNDTASYICGPAATYVTKLELVSNRGCRSFATKTTQVYNRPVAAFSVASGTCIGDSTLFTNTSSLTGDAMAYYRWDFGDGQSGMQSGSFRHYYSAAAYYPVSLLAVSEHLCKDSISLGISVYALPSLSLQLSGDTVLYDNQSITLTAISSATSFLWSNGVASPSISVNQTGAYTVEATDVNLCKNSTGVNVVKKETPPILLTNDVITPNTDGVNDYLTFDGLQAYTGCEVTVYNIWGDEVFRSTDYKNNWEGTYNGKPLEGGAYYYILKCSGQQEIKGNINILR